MAPFLTEMEKEFGAATSLEDFDRKAQMLNYVPHRAIFEGMNAHLWAPNTGRMLWMTQPAWPSSTWQIFSSDYDTQTSFYGVKKASEPLHVQLDPPVSRCKWPIRFPPPPRASRFARRSLHCKTVCSSNTKKRRMRQPA
jgi:hypothetical protein